MKQKTLLLVICLFFPLANTFKTQAREIEITESPTLEQPTNKPQKQPISSSEIAPLFKAAAKLLSEDRYQIESEMILTGDAPGIQFTSNVRIKTITEAPNKFNSEITFFSPNGLSGKQFKIISDGQQVWIYDLSTNQYSVSGYQEFIESNDGFFLGVVSFFYLSLQSDSENANVYARFLSSLSEEELIKFLETEFKIDYENVSMKEETLNNIPYKVYQIKDRESGFVFDFSLNSLLNEVEIVSISGKQSGLDITMKEQVNSKISPLSLSRETFSFLPSVGSKKVEQTLEIKPF